MNWSNQNWKVVGAAVAWLAMAAPAVHAQSVTSAPTPSENLTQLQERVGELEGLLQQATGENERLSIELRRTRAENDRLQKLLNDALAQQSGAATAPNAGGALGTLPADAVPAGDPTQLLRDGNTLLQSGRYGEAEAAFAAYARANPQAPDTPEARYYVGRTQVAQRHFPDAADTFVKLLADFPAAPRAPDSWLMLGVSLKGMGKTPEACGVFRDLPVKYPRASANTRNQAAAEARAAQCAAPR